MKALFDEGGLLADLKLSQAQEGDWKRVLFFSGSFCHSGRAIPGLEIGKTLVDGSATDGDKMECVGKKQYGPPTILAVEPTPIPGKDEVRIDPHRIAGSTKTFDDTDKLLKYSLFL